MRIGRFLTDPIVAALPGWLYCRLVNIRCVMQRWDVRLHALEDGGLYLGTWADEEIYIARRNRLKRYRRGIRRSIDELARSYRFDCVPIAPGDKIIDCGANIGEIGIWAKRFRADYHPFEPEEEEAACCDRNNFAGQRRTIRKALWFEETELKFFSKPESADSSAIEINGFREVKVVPATTLARYINSLDNPSVRLLKVEAEGAEPEVLRGAEGVFHHIDYIAVDCGYERGKEQAPTFDESNEILRQNNFEVINANFDRWAFLYRRRDLLTRAA